MVTSGVITSCMTGKMNAIAGLISTMTTCTWPACSAMICSGLGNILIFLVGGGDLTIQQLTTEKAPALDDLSAEDMNIIFNNRVANIQKIYPYVTGYIKLYPSALFKWCQSVL